MHALRRLSDLTSARALATRIAQQRPELERHGIHLLVSPTPYGDWIVGDSHDYGQDARPFNAESVDTLMLDRRARRWAPDCA